MVTHFIRTVWPHLTLNILPGALRSTDLTVTKGLGHRFYRSGSNSTIFEIINGVGGSEAMLFADDLLGLYQRYFTLKNWPYQMEEHIRSELGGIKSAKVIISSADAFRDLISEAGVHRVQRIPRTEKSGRMHTSTVSIAVIPKSVLDIQIKESDVSVSTMRSSGPGGQHVNKVETAIRLVHKPTGVVSECQETRSQIQNKAIAFKKLLDRIRAAELEKIASKTSSMRSTQLGHSERNEKIRTYNFPQDRITDHRTGKSYQRLKSMFDGEVSILEKIIRDIQQENIKTS